jgi:uncharacterized protein
MIIVDVNLLLYAHNTAAPQYRRAADWLEQTVESGETIGIPWHCVMAFLRITTASFGATRPLELTQTTSIIDSWFADPRFLVPRPGVRFWSILKEVGEDSGTRGGAWSDAYLAALAIENGAGFATFDRDFRKFKGLKLVEL